MISTKQIVIIGLATLLIFFGCVQMKYTSKVDKHGNMHLVIVENASHAIEYAILLKFAKFNKTTVTVDESGIKNLTTQLKKSYEKDCEFYKEYNKKHPQYKITCQIKNTSDDFEISKNKTLHLTGLPYLVISYNETPDAQWPTHFYNFSKKIKGSKIIYSVTYIGLPAADINKTTYNKIMTSSNKSGFLITWGNETVTIEKNGSIQHQYVGKGGAFSWVDLVHISAKVEVPGKIVNVSPRCAATIINDHEVLFNISKIYNVSCKKELWTLTKKYRRSFDNMTIYQYHLKRVPLVVVSEEPKPESHAQTTTKSNIQANNSTTQPSNNKSNHSFCATSLILLGVLASLFWIRGESR